jgi:hypothetical protein
MEPHVHVLALHCVSLSRLAQERNSLLFNLKLMCGRITTGLLYNPHFSFSLLSSFYFMCLYILYFLCLFLCFYLILLVLFRSY